ncbi:MAG: DUF2267 domain-containing protein [Alphaproteobacteria bacterium]
MEELIQRIVANVGVDEGIARKAVGVVMSFLHSDGPTDKVEELAGKIDGAADYFGASDSEGGGMLGSLMGGGAMAAVGKLQGLGLGMGEIQGVTSETIAFAKEKCGDDLVDEIVGAIPGLSQFV